MNFPALIEIITIQINNNIFGQILTFLYSIAHQLGLLVAQGFQFLFPEIIVPENIINAMGFMILLTIFVILTQAAKKIATWILIVGWALLLIRIILLAFGVV